jgi:NodT family efflux transporter outer membrane factor (OMF) lipoprotein
MSRTAPDIAGPRSGRTGAIAVAALLSSWAALLSSCAVGPDFEPPAPPQGQPYDLPDPYRSVHAEGGAAPPAAAVDIVPGRDIPAQWWQMFRCPALDDTLRAALSASPTMAAAQANLDAAREAVVVARSGFLPRLGAAAGTERTGSGPGPAPALTQYSLGLDATYSLSAFGGGTVRSVEQSRALADVQRYQLAATYLTLTGGVVVQALNIASARLQITITNDLLANDRKNLALTQRMFEVGAAARTDVLTAESQLAADETSLPSLEQQLAVSQHALAVLAGRSPGDWAAPPFELAQFSPPPEVPLSLPSALVHQRPDILASEGQLHAASAAIGIALANEYPSLDLSAGLTRNALTAANLFHEFQHLWDIGGTIAQPLFEGGALRAQTRAARDEFKAQTATYVETVITAFGQVSDDLRALGHDDARVAAFAHSLKIAEESLELQRVSYKAGRTSILQLIDAQRSYSQARLGSAGAEVERLEDASNLLVALGGGWWASPVIPPAAQAVFKP